MGKTIENKETRKLQRVFNLAEIREGRIPSKLGSTSVSNFKRYERNQINEDAFFDFKIIINNYSILLDNFSKKPVKPTQAYLLELMDLIDTPYLNWNRLYNNIICNEKPHYTYLQHSYFNTVRRGDNSPNENIILKYAEFFEKLRQEIKLLAFKLKI